MGAISGAKHVHLLAKAYGVPVILHTDHAARKLLPWIDGLIEANAQYKKPMDKLYLVLICLILAKKV